MASSSKKCNFCQREFNDVAEHEKLCAFLYDDNEDYFILCNSGLAPDFDDSAPQPKRRRISSPLPEDDNDMLQCIDQICQYCGEGFPDRERRIAHETLHLPEDDNDMLQFIDQICQYCGEGFPDRERRTAHETLHTRNPNCAKCHLEFENILERNAHETECKFSALCESCGGIFTSRILFNSHLPLCQNEMEIEEQREPHVRQFLAAPPAPEQIMPYETAFANRLESYFIQSDFTLDLPLFLNDVKKKIVRVLTQSMNTHGNIIFNLLVDCLMENSVGDTLNANLKTPKFEVLMDVTDLDEILPSLFKKLNTELSEIEMKRSGWKLDKVLGLRLKICKYSPLRGGDAIQIPRVIQNRKACINVPDGEGSQCFKFAVLAKFVPIHQDRRTNYTPHENKYDFSCVGYPTSLADIKRFEAVNNISISVFVLNERNIVVQRKKAWPEKEDHRDLLMLEEGEKRHFVWIKDFNKLVRAQITTHRRHRINICKNCMWYKKTEPESGDILAHEHLCNSNPSIAVQMPSEENKFIEFKEVEKGMKVPFVVYADFEALLEKFDTCARDPGSSSMEKYNQHKPISVCAYLQIDPEFSHISQHLADRQLFLYRCEDVVEKLLEYLDSIAEEVYKIYSTKAPMTPLTPVEQREYSRATNCYLCTKPFTEDNPKVRDHCHVFSNYRGAAHNKCNLRYRLPNFLPVFFHNLSAYDAQFIIRKLNYNDKRISVIASNKEKYISFSKYVTKKFSLRFLDTFRFLSASLDKLSENLKQFDTLKKYFPDPDQFQLAKQKGVYPYEYMDKTERFNETQLPPQSAFYSRLRHAGIEDAEYVRAQNVWEKFNCENMGDYHDLYNKIDTLLLCDIFERFRAVTLRSHELDPAQFFTTPQMSWTAMLKHISKKPRDNKIELLTDYNMLLMVESGIRGGLCQVTERYAKANNPLVPDYDPEEDTTYIAYQDCNALYATVMTKPLPIGGFSWIDPKDVPDLDTLNENDEYGFLLDVDVKYPANLHDVHNDLPFLPEKLKEIDHKLTAHLGDRQNYVAHHMALKEAKKHGVITPENPMKINRAIKYRQSPWLRSYIEMNNELRKNTNDDFEKDLFKLYNNSIYGKTCEQIRHRIDLRLITKFEQAEKLMAKSNFMDADILDENLVAIQMRKTTVNFNKPIFTGQAILDLSKNVMYHYFYGVLKQKYRDDRLRLLYMDTDSFIMKIKTEDMYDDMKGEFAANYLDTSNYPTNHPLYSNGNKKRLGFFKDEAHGKAITRFVGLRPKMYCIEIEGENPTKRVKGIQRCVVQNKITMEDYLRCLNREVDADGKLIIRRDLCTSIRSMKHKLFSVELNKLSLSPFDDKRHILDDGIRTLALNHRALRQDENEEE